MKTICCKDLSSSLNFRLKQDHEEDRLFQCQVLMLFLEDSEPERRIFQQFQNNIFLLRKPSLHLHQEHQIYQIRLLRIKLCQSCVTFANNNSLVGKILSEKFHYHVKCFFACYNFCIRICVHKI